MYASTKIRQQFLDKMSCRLQDLEKETLGMIGLDEK
jgi:hypothetical protein